jgi:Secretion system C-terminal sorting domain
MMRTILCAVMLCIALTNYAQSTNTNKKDTVVLSVYNDNQKYMLYPSPFYKKWPDTSMVVSMVMLYDTAHVMRQSTQTDSTGKKPMRSVVEPQCSKLSGEAQGKIALVRLNPNCDVSFTCLMAQRMGAKVVVLIHTTNSIDSVTIPKMNKQTHAYQDSIKIPCYTVRNEIGDRLMRMLPSLAGIKIPNGTPIQALGTNPNTNQLPIATSLADIEKAQALKEATEAAAQKLENEKRSSPNVKGWQLLPNPSSTEAQLQFNFDTSSSLIVDIFNAAGQMVTNYNLPTSQAGTLGIDVSSWANGVYSVRLSRGELKEVKQLVVQK